MIHKKLLTLLVLLLTAATGAWADIAVGNVFKTGSTIDFGTTSKRYIANSGSSDNFTLGATGKQTLTYQEYTNGRHQFSISMGSGSQSISIVSDNTAEPWGIRVSGGEGTMGNPYSFEVLFEEQVSLSINNTKDVTEFAMPDYDATVAFEIVRDMSEQMVTKVGNADDGADYRIRLQKDGKGGWELADITLDALKALITVHDGIEDKYLELYGQDAVCTLSIFAIDDDNQPTGQAIDFQNLTPGRYVAIAKAKDGGYYIGETALSNVIVLFQGYEVEVPAGEYVTYYKEEGLYADPETSSDAQLYTITDLNDDKASITLLSVAPAYTPLLVKNTTEQTKTFLLIPTEDQADNVTPYRGFTGTLDATTIAASTENKANYAFNGKQFIWVKNDLPIAANKAWLEVSNINARSIKLVVDSETTGLSEELRVKSEEFATAQWYTIDGRKVQRPNKKGVYIQNGKKVVK
jgi:hypothetical protein